MHSHRSLFDLVSQDSAVERVTGLSESPQLSIPKNHVTKLQRGYPPTTPPRTFSFLTQVVTLCAIIGRNSLQAHLTDQCLKVVLITPIEKQHPTPSSYLLSASLAPKDIAAQQQTSAPSRLLYHNPQPLNQSNHLLFLIRTSSAPLLPYLSNSLLK